MKKTLLIVCILFINYSYGQNAKIVPLKPGDRLPDLPMAQVLLNGKTVKLNSKDYENKLLIIDFWDTWCSNCIESFPKLDLLQRTYQDKIQIISATYQKEDVIRAFKSKNALAKAFSLPIMTNDTLFKSYFPYKSVPHTVWIDKGEVIAIVGNEYLGKEMIEKVLRGEKINLPIKNDYLSYDFKRASILGNNPSGKGKIWSAITGFNPNVGDELVSSTVDSVTGTVKDVFLNREITRLYIGLLLDIKKRDYVLEPDMVIVESNNPERYDQNYKKPGDYSQDWLIRNAICYESVLPSNLDKKQRALIMIKDLDNKLGLHGRMETRPHKVFVLQVLKGSRPAIDESMREKTVKKIDYKKFKSQLIYNIIMYPELRAISPIVDEYNKPNRQLDVYSYKDLPSLKRYLNLNGLDIIESTRPIEVFVLSEERRNIIN